MSPAEGRGWTDEEMMVIAASRLLRDAGTCFVGIGLPSSSAMIAQRLCGSASPFLVYESGTLGVEPARLPLSVADDALAESALTIVGVPELFNDWLQPGRIDVALIGAAQIDRFANVNSTVIGPGYERPRVRLPGAGGAPEIVGAAGEALIMIRQSRRSFVESVDFITTVGHGSGADARRGLGLWGGGPSAVISDIGVYRPAPESAELTLTHLHPGRELADARDATGWELASLDEVATSDPPSAEELRVLRALGPSGPPADRKAGR